MMNNRNIPNRSHGQRGKYWYQKTPDILLDQEIVLLLSEALKYGRRDYTLILFALNTGLRNSEVLGLNVENVYPYGTVVNILDLPAQIAKNKKPRIIPLKSTIKTDLEIYLNEELDSKRITGGESPLFRSKFTNKRLGPRDFQQRLRKHSINSIKRAVYPHVLRHTFATKLLQQSNIKIVQEILGHTYLQSSQVYLHPSRSDKIEAVSKLNLG